jgi:hypothetical protein
MNTTVTLRTALLLMMTLYLASCYSDGSFVFEKSNLWRLSSARKIDRIARFEKYDAHKIDSAYIDLFVPKDMQVIRKSSGLLYELYFHDNYNVFFTQKLNSLCIHKRIWLYKNDIEILQQEFQEYGKNTLELLRRNKHAGFQMSGQSTFSDAKDTNLININTEEYYYFCHFSISQSNLYYSSRFYYNKFTIHCFEDILNSNYEHTELTLPRIVGVQHTYKLISSIITYKNKQIDSINVIRRTEHQPELERYSWYGMR